MERYADIVLPLAQPAYTYAVADGLAVEEGQAVAVQFGVRRIYTGIVWRIHGRRPDFPRIKTVSRVLYDRPPVSYTHLSRPSGAGAHHGPRPRRRQPLGLLRP